MTTDSNPRETVLRTGELLAWTVGILLLAVYFGIRGSQTSAAQHGLFQFRSARALSWPRPDQSLWSPERVRAWHQSLAASKAAPLAVLRIPSLKLEVPILEGTDDATLDRGVGHISGTALPGMTGNLGIAGHRDGFFRVLKDITTGASIELETLAGTKRYVVESLFLVDPRDVWVLEPATTSQLTLVTCFPFYYQGSAPQRFIVRAVPAAPLP
jgi:sortase A